MNDASSMILIGIGTAGSAVARGVSRAFGEGLRFVAADTDAATGQGDGRFVLLGGDRLSGRGTGGDFVTGRIAAEDSIDLLDEAVEGVRLAVIVTALGGGTGGGATLEAVKHLRQRGIPTVVFATTPFTFEGDSRQQNARGVMTLIKEAAGATFFIPLDKLVGSEDNMDAAMRRAVDTLASAVTLFWRLAEKPGYIRLDAERIRQMVSSSGRGRFATVTVQGPDRAAEAVDALARSPLLTDGSGPVRAILCGILAGEDLRLSEVGRVADGVRAAFGENCRFELATVNDEATFTGRMSVVAMLFESSGEDGGAAGEAEPPGSAANPPRRQAKRSRNPLAQGPQGRGRFNNSEPTVYNGEDLDTPTYIRRNIRLDC